MRILLVFQICCLVVFSSCEKKEPYVLAEVQADEKYTGGTNGTGFDFGENAFGAQVDGLTFEESGFFVTGNSFFRTNWVSAPGSVASIDGLGPILNDISCSSCHFKDGRAQPPGQAEGPLRGLLFRLSIPGAGPHNEPLGDPIYGTQFQDKSISNVMAEGLVNIQYVEMEGNYSDGQSYTLRKPNYSFSDWKFGEASSELLVSPRIAQQLPGLGLLEMVPEEDILVNEDPNDNNNDGVSGRANYVWDQKSQSLKLGRFGWKANQPNLLQQTAGAFNGDIGITSNLFPVDHLTPAQRQIYPNLANGGVPEISDEILNKVVSYVQSLAVPARRYHEEREVLHGKYLFEFIGCQACHRQQYITAEAGGISALWNQKIWPYTDLLLHDMGPDLADGCPDFLASGTEWRTPPLWGIGLIPVVNDHHFLLHDGRARNIEEAILWHGGEAESARDHFKKLSQEDRSALIQFVESL